MARSRRARQQLDEVKRDPRVTQLAHALINVADCNNISLNEIRFLMDDIEEQIEKEIRERKARRFAEIEAGRATWQREHGHLDAQAFADRLGIDVRELPTAERLGFVQQLEWPAELRKPDDYRRQHWSGLYAADTTLSDEQRRKIAETALLSREEAAERLGITPARFDWLRQQAGLTPNIAGTYRLCDIEALREQAESLPVPQSSGKTHLITLWNGLNKRQQAYLEAIYDVDQAQEQYERGRFSRGERSRPAAEWRQIEYGWLPGMPPIPSPLYEAIDRLGMRDEGTGSTFNALEARKLIECHYPGRKAEMSVVITMLGRRVVRAGTGELPALRPSKEMIKDWAWKHLAALYKAGNSGVDDYRFGVRTLDYLQDRDLITKKAGVIKLSQIGRQHYEEHYHMYRELYPHINAPEPSTITETDTRS